MRILTVAVLSAAVAAGTGGAFVAYELATPSARTADVSATPVEPARRTQREPSRPRFAPCTTPAKLERGVCVTDEVRTVVLPAAQAQQTRPVSQTPVAGDGSRSTSDVVHEGDDDHDDDRDDHDHDDDRDDHDDDRDDHDDDDRDDD